MQKWKLNEVDVNTVWLKMVEKISNEDLELVSIVMRKTWLRRNRYIFEKFISPRVLFNQARTRVIEYQQVQSNISKSLKANIVEMNMIRQKAPMEIFVKVN